MCRQHMEVQKLVFMQILLLLGIELTLLARSGSCMHTLLLSSEEGKCNSNSDVKTQTTSGFPGLEKYIAEPYFRKHDSLVESDFQNFIANELPLGLCQVLQNKLNPVQRLSVHQRHLIGEGSHRRLSSSIRLPIQSLSIPELPRHFCKIIIVERLPSGVFADPFELQHLLLHGVFTEAAVFGDTNLELPSVVSNQSVVEVHMDVGDNILTGLNNGLEINIELPLHARYAPLGERGFSRVEFGEPAIFMHCYIEGMSNDQSCLFLAAAGDAAASPTVGWEVPCGIKGHSGVVSAVTFVSAAVSAFLIVLTSIFYPDIQKSAAF